MRRITLVIVSLLLVLSVGYCQEPKQSLQSTSEPDKQVDAKKALNVFGIQLFQPDFILKERLGDVKELSVYIKDIEGAISRNIQSRPKFFPASGFITVAVKPSGKTFVWLDFMPSLDPQIAEAIKGAVKDVRPFVAKKGVVLVALRSGIWGGKSPDVEVFIPAEWKAFSERTGHNVEVGELVEMILQE